MRRANGSANSKRSLDYRKSSDLKDKKTKSLRMHQRSASTSGRNSIEVRLEERTVWLTHTLISEFYQTTIFTINIPIGNIFKGGELNAGSGIKKYVTTAADGKSYRITYYNPIMILAISYQV